MSPDSIRKPLYYDTIQHRLWINGQRCHHGATGALLVSAGLIGFMRLRVPALAGLAAAGVVLMAHDWRDRALWFARGM